MVRETCCWAVGTEWAPTVWLYKHIHTFYSADVRFGKLGCKKHRVTPKHDLLLQAPWSTSNGRTSSDLLFTSRLQHAVEMFWEASVLGISYCHTARLVLWISPVASVRAPKASKERLTAQCETQTFPKFHGGCMQRSSLGSISSPSSPPSPTETHLYNGGAVQLYLN